VKLISQSNKDENINILLMVVAKKTLIVQTKGFYLKVKTKLIGAGVRDSCGKSVSRGEPAGAMAPRAAESECLERKSTFKLYKSKINCRKTRFSLSLSTV